MAQNMTAFSKICLVGPEEVGKTSLLRRALHDFFPPEYKKTIGVDFSVINKTIDPITHELHFWDIGGAEQPNMLKVYLKPSAQVVICFDASATTDDAHEQVRAVIAKIKAATAADGASLPYDMPITLIGCKDDLRSEPFNGSRILALAQEQFPNARKTSMFVCSALNKTAAKVIPCDSELQTIPFDTIIESLATTSVALEAGATSQTVSTGAEAAHADSGNTADSSGYLGRLLCCFWSGSNNRNGEHAPLVGATASSRTPAAGR